MGTILKNGISYSGSGSGSGGVSSYDELTNKPSINNVSLVGNKTTADLGISSATKTSELTNDSGFYSSNDTAETALADADYFPFYDASSSGNKKTLWSNIKSTLSSIFQPKLTAGNNITIDSNNNIYATMPVMGTFSKGDLYSTTEKVIGCWTDGRPLYQKVVDFGAGANKTVKSVSHGISNISTVVDIHFFGQMGSGSGSSGSLVAGMCDATYEYWNDSGSVSAIAVYLLADKIYMDCRHDASMYTYKFVIKYTKTSDSSNSYNYASENDYSTSEKIIGTWIGGQTLYQRTYSITTPSTAYSDTEMFSVSGMYIKSVEGVICWQGTSSTSIVPLTYACGGSNASSIVSSCMMYVASNKFCMKINDTDCLSKTAYVTFKYTKS